LTDENGRSSDQRYSLEILFGIKFSLIITSSEIFSLCPINHAGNGEKNTGVQIINKPKEEKIANLLHQKVTDFCH
jgi:hypothetical protein